MKNVLVVIDMQNDFIDGSLGTKEACKTVDPVIRLVEASDDTVFATLDTHGLDYFSTLEGKKLPVEHCIKDTEGWKIKSEILDALNKKNCTYIEKPTFGSFDLVEKVAALNPDKITLCGLCTDICVISNALLLRAKMPNVTIEVIRDACAGTTVENHEVALTAMKSCQIDIL